MQRQKSQGALEVHYIKYLKRNYKNKSQANAFTYTFFFGLDDPDVLLSATAGDVRLGWEDIDLV